MGMWENDCRQGSGVIVTVEGIYNEGIFVQNKLVVGVYDTKIDKYLYHQPC